MLNLKGIHIEYKDGQEDFIFNVADYKETITSVSNYLEYEFESGHVRHQNLKDVARFTVYHNDDTDLESRHIEYLEKVI